MDLLDFEREVFGLDHSEAGRWLSEKWNLPEEFRIIAGRHHDPCEGTEVSLQKLVHIGCRLADLFEYDVIRPLKPPNFEELMSLLPEPAQESFMGRIDAIYERVKKAVHGFDEETEPDRPPEELGKLPVLLPKDERYIEVSCQPVEEPDEADLEGEREAGFFAKLIHWLTGWLRRN